MRDRFRLRWVVAVAVAVGSLTGVGTTPAVTEAALADQIFDNTPRQFGPITVLGDSVMQGGLIVSPTIVDQLAANGWGPIRARAGVGYNTRTSGGAAESHVSYWIDLWRSQGWDPTDVVINLGANDSGACSVECARAAILRVVDAIGPGHRVWWPMITRHWVYQHEADAWNTALAQVAEERDDFYTWDWPAAMAAAGIRPADNTHPNADGYRARSAMMAYEITADLARGTRLTGPAPLPAPAGDPTGFVPVTSTRVLDTREATESRPALPVSAGHAVPVDSSDVVPAGATAVAAYVSATNTAGPGFLTAYECGTPMPTASNANYQGGDTRGALTIVPLDSSGRFCLYTLAEADLLVDIQGAFVPAQAVPDPDSEPDPDEVPVEPFQLSPLERPIRLVDTRETGRQQTVAVRLGNARRALAVSANITAVAGSDPGYLVAFPCGTEPPLSATVNYLAGEAIAGAAFVPLSDDEELCVYSSSPLTDVVIDVTGTFVPAGTSGALAFVPAAPTRTIDSREGIGGWSPIHGAGQTLDTRVAPAGARAVSGTITLASPMRPGYLTAWGCGDMPPTSNVNSPAGATFANFVTVGVGTSGDAAGRMCVYSLAAAGTVFDTTGWWVAGDGS